MEPLYQSRNIIISRQQISVGSTTYAVRNVSAVRVQKMKMSSGLGTTLLVFGVLGCIGGGISLLVGLSGAGGQALGWGLAIVAASIAGIVYGSKMNNAARTLHRIFFSTNAGEVCAMTTYDPGEAEQITRAVHQAMAEVGG